MDARPDGQRNRVESIRRKKFNFESGQFAGSDSSRRRRKFTVEKRKQKEREKYMSKHKFSQAENQKPARASRPTAAVELNQNEIDFTSSPDEAASYVNQSLPQGHEAQHWLAAEAQLLAERKLTQVHGFHNRINFPGNPP